MPSFCISTSSTSSSTCSCSWGDHLETKIEALDKNERESTLLLTFNKDPQNWWMSLNSLGQNLPVYVERLDVNFTCHPKTTKFLVSLFYPIDFSTAVFYNNQFARTSSTSLEKSEVQGFHEANILLQLHEYC